MIICLCNDVEHSSNKKFCTLSKKIQTNLILPLVTFTIFVLPCRLHLRYSMIIKFHPIKNKQTTTQQSSAVVKSATSTLCYHQSFL